MIPPRRLAEQHPPTATARGMGLRPSALDRYVFRQLAGGLVAATLGLALLVWTTQSLRFVQLVIDRGLSFVTFLALTSLLLPNLVAVILPITAFLVVLFVYQRLAGDRELTVLRAAGLSPFAISRPALAMAALAMALGWALNLWLVPTAFGAFRTMQFEVRSRVAAYLLQPGVFNRVGRGLTVYVRARDDSGTLYGILVNDSRPGHTPVTLLAARGRIITSPGPPRVVLLDGSRQTVSATTGRLDLLRFAQNTIGLSEEGPARRLRDYTEMSLGELLHPDPATVMAQDFGKLRVEAHRRLSSPFTILGFVLTALVATLNGRFQRHRLPWRVIAAGLVVIALSGLGLAAGNLAARQPDLIGLIWVTALLPALAAGGLLFVPGWRVGSGPARAAGGMTTEGGVPWDSA